MIDYIFASILVMCIGALVVIVLLAAIAAVHDVWVSHGVKSEIRKAVLRIYRDNSGSDVVVLGSSCSEGSCCRSDYLFDSYRNAKLFSFVKRMMLVCADDVTDKGNGSFSLWVSCLSRSERRELRDLVFAARRERLEKRSLKKRAENTAKIEEAFPSVKD